MDPIISLIIALVVICFLIWAARSLMAAFGIGDPVATVIYVVLVLLILLYILRSGLVSGVRL